MNRKEILLLLCLFLMAMYLRLIPVMKTESIVLFDNAFMAALGGELVHGHINDGLHGFYPPFYPLMIGIFSLVIKDVALAARLICVVFGSLIIFPIFLLAKQLYNSKTAILSCFFVAIHPFMIYMSKGMHKEIIFVFLIILFFWINFLAFKKKSIGLFFIGGLIIGLSYLTKGEGLVYLVLFLLCNVYLIFRLSLGKKFLIKSITFILIGFLSVSFYYIWFLSKQEGKLTFSSRLTFALLHRGNYMPRMERVAFGLIDNGHSTPQHIAQTLGRRYALPEGLISYYKKNIVNNLKETLRNIYRVFNYILPDFLPIFLITFITIHFLNLANKEVKIEREWYLLFFVLFSLFVYTAIAIRHRRVFSCLPILLIWSSRGIDIFSMKVKRFFKENRHKFLNIFGRGIIVKFVIVVILLLFFMPNIFKALNLGKGKRFIDRESYSDKMYMKSVDSGYIQHKEVGLWLKENLPTDARIMSYDYAFAFYQGVNPTKTHFMFPYAAYRKIIDFARYNKIDYIIISSAFSHYRPSLKFLLDEKNIPSELSLIYKYPPDNKSGSKKVLVYKINKG